MNTFVTAGVVALGVGEADVLHPQPPEAGRGRIAPAGSTSGAMARKEVKSSMNSDDSYSILTLKTAFISRSPPRTNTAPAAVPASARPIRPFRARTSRAATIPASPTVVARLPSSDTRSRCLATLRSSTRCSS